MHPSGVQARESKQTAWKPAANHSIDSSIRWDLGNTTTMTTTRETVAHAAMHRPTRDVGGLLRNVATQANWRNHFCIVTTNQTPTGHHHKRHSHPRTISNISVAERVSPPEGSRRRHRVTDDCQAAHVHATEAPNEGGTHPSGVQARKSKQTAWKPAKNHSIGSSIRWDLGNTTITTTTRETAALAAMHPAPRGTVRAAPHA